MLFICGRFCFAQVSVSLQQPPPNQLRATDIWKLTLINSGRITLQITLNGTLEQAGEGIIVEGNSKPFSLPPGVKRITYDDVKSGNVNFKSGKWREAFTRTGNAPSGDYTICIHVKDNSGEEIGSNCIDQKVEIASAPALNSPADGETIPVEQQPLFTWLPPMPPPSGQITYNIKIVEILGGQAPETAVQRNPVWFENASIRTTMFQYPLSAEKIENDKKYAWQITAIVNNEEIGKSEVWSFIYGRKELPEKIAEIIQCDVFKVEFKKTNTGDTLCYKLLITNNYNGKVPGNKPGSFRIAVKGDSVGSIEGGVSDGWRRTPSKFPPGSSAAYWKPASGYIPNDTTDLGNIVFRNTNSTAIKVIYEWLNKEETSICKDSCTINKPYKSYLYYELSKELPDNLIEVPDNFLNVQYANNYSSFDNIILNIYDVEKYELVKPISEKGKKQNSTDEDDNYKSYNGINRISINLKDYGLQPKTTYLLIVSDSNTNYYFNFKVTGEHEK